MNKEDLRKQIDQLQNKFNEDRKQILRAYCDANNPYKIDEIFTDHMGSIIVESMQYHYGTIPECIYYGTILKKMELPEQMVQKEMLGKIMM